MSEVDTWEDDQDEAYDEASYDDAESGDSTSSCPNCLQAIYEDAEQCPGCGFYLTELARQGGRPMWVVVTAIICLCMMVLGILASAL